jgi:hypothetical protein
MNMKFKLEGADGVLRKFADMSKRAGEINGSEVALTEIFTPKFLSTCSKFTSTQEMFTAAGFSGLSQVDYDAMPREDLDAFVRSNTSYDSWEAMYGAAGAEYIRTKIGFKE